MSRPANRVAAVLIALSFLPPVAALAETGSPKLRIEGETLVYDTEMATEGWLPEIAAEDIAPLLEKLRAHPGLTTLELNSSGGSVYASGEIARIVLDAALDTVVAGECSSACVDIFLAGQARGMLLGSKIGFHGRVWPPGAIEAYYEANRLAEGWRTPFDMGSWIYLDTQIEVVEHLQYMIDRGVDAAFAMRAKSVLAGDTWFPNRQELMRAGVLRE